MEKLGLNGRIINTDVLPGYASVDDIVEGTQTYAANYVDVTATFSTTSVSSILGGTEVNILSESMTMPGAEMEAKIASTSGSGWQYEYSITDHLGNTRAIFADLNGNGIISAEEVLDAYDYYPFGLEMKGSYAANRNLSPHRTVNERYQYNGIEHIPTFDLGYNMASYRGLDPSMGR